MLFSGVFFFCGHGRFHTDKIDLRMPTNDRTPLVAMIANYPKGTGYAWWLMERLWNEIAAAAADKGWQSVIVYPVDSVDDDTAKTSANSSRLGAFLSRGSIRDVIGIYSLVRQLNIHGIYLTDHPFFSWKYLILRLSGVRSIVVHDHTPGDRPPVTGIRGLVKRLLNTLPWITATLYIAISPLMRQRHILNARIPPSRIVTVTNGIIARDTLPNARELLLEKFGLSPDCYIVYLHPLPHNRWSRWFAGIAP